MVFQYDESLFETKAELLKSMGHPVRLCILRGLMERGPSYPGHIQTCLDLPQSTISQHLARLRRMGIIKGTRFGQEIRYELVDRETKELLTVLFPKEMNDHE